MTEQMFRLMTPEEITHWYSAELSEAFAENERKPLADILALIKAKRYELWGLFDGRRMLGYAGLWLHPEIPLVLLDYLGVSAPLRGGGLGARLLSLLRDRGGPIAVEAELPVPGDGDEANRLRLRRIGFYCRNGFTPAYEMATCGMRWQALLTGAEAFPLHDVMAWHRALYGPERTDVRVPLAPGEKPEPPYWMAGCGGREMTV